MRQKRDIETTIFLAVLGKLGPYLGVVAVIGALLLVMGGGGGTAATPVPPPVSEKKAEEYGIMGSELGIPYDIVMLVNMFLADHEKRRDIEDVNPVFTALEFGYIEEKREDRHEYESCSTSTWTDDEGNTHESESCSTYYVWEYGGTEIYTGKSDILGYISKSEKDELHPSEVVPAIQEAAEEKGDEDTRYTASFSINSDYAAVLERFPIKKEERSAVLELYEKQYIAQLYGDYIDITPSPGSGSGSGGTSGGGELPDIIVGNVTRKDLIEVATSIINHPYHLGGKDPRKGKPTRPMDCSGFVDWVYIQLFGKSISSMSSTGGAGTAMQFYASEPISEDELQIGDLGFYYHPKEVKGGYNHVGIYIGKINGKNAFIHCGGEWYGTPSLPEGRVGISLNGKRQPENNINPLGGTFSPPMKYTEFKIFHRPRVEFKS